MERKRQGTEIREFEGFGIYYARGTKKFIAYDKENRVVAEAETEDKLINQIRAHHKRKWTPVEVISRDNKCVVTITSRDIKEPEREVWISWKGDKGETHVQKSYAEDWHGPQLYEKTDDNLKIIERIQANEKQIGKLEEENDQLLQKLKKPFKLPPLSS